MALSLIIDDTSLLLLLAIILLLAVSILLGKSYQPLVHPLILSRQSDVSAVRHKGQSSIYRNANAPAGFELSSQPRRAIVTVADVVAQASGVTAAASSATEKPTSVKRTLYGSHRSNDDVRNMAIRFATGVAKHVGQSSGALNVAVCVETDSFASLVATLSGSHAPGSGQRFAPMIIAPAHLKAGHAPKQLPSSTASPTLHAVFTTRAALEAAQSMPIVSDATVFIVESADGVQTTKANRLVPLGDVLAQGHADSAAPPATEKTDDVQAAAALTHSTYWAGEAGWVSVSNASLIAGLTAQLGFYPSDSQPTAVDHIFIEQSPAFDSPSLRLCAAATPAGLVLALLALYTGAALTTATISSSHADPNPSASADFHDTQPTLLFCSPAGASSLAACLCTVTKRSPLAKLAAHTKLAALRHGTFSKTGMWDSFVFGKTRVHVGATRLRSIMILAEGPTVSQGLLDVLRAQLGCPVRLAYLPSGALRLFDTSVQAGVGASDAVPSNAHYALPTAPLTAAHSLDLQAFAAHVHDGRQVPSHVGPPSVTVEVKLVETARATKKGLRISGVSTDTDAGRAEDPFGEVFVRGTSLAGTTSSGGAEQWCATGDLATFRSNGTLVVLQDAAQSPEVDVPTLSSEYPSSRRTSRLGAGGHRTRTVPLVTTILAASLVCLCGVNAASSSSSSSSSRVAHQLMRRDASPNTTFVDTAISAFMTAQRASWEQGVAQSALLEYYAGSWSVFAGEARPPYLTPGSSGSMPGPLLAMAYSAVKSQDSAGQLCSRVTGDESATEGSALDPAACGEAVLLAAYANGQVSNGQVDGSSYFGRAAQRQLNYLLDTAPKNPSGAISMRSTGEAYWSDGVYMAPPFIALYGLMTGNESLLQTAYDQIRLYRDALRIPSGPAQGLFRHILNATSPTAGSNDDGAWLTGNAWSAAGICRVIASIAQSQYATAMASQTTDLVSWTGEIVRAALAQGNPLMHNYINDTSTFQDAGGSAMIAYATYRLAGLAPEEDLSAQVSQSENIYNAVQGRLGPDGQMLPGTSVVDPLVFTTSSQGSPESMSFMVLMAAARRDHAEGNVTGLTGPGSGFNGAATPFAVSMAWVGIASVTLSTALLL